MNQKELAIEADKYIRIWAQTVDKLVVAVDGYTGVGKTTLVNELAKLNPDITFIHQDDFLLPKEQIEKLLADAKDKSKVFELEVRDNRKLEGVINLFKTGESEKGILVIDGVFMFHPQNLNHLWNRRIYLTGDLQKIDE
ncbi:MAG: hypothetical protein AAB453_00815 [Patescibacteria group bacterium]